MNRKILDLAVPNIISNISIPLLGIVDMALMGHLESDAYIGAIALGLLIFNFIYWSLVVVFSFLIDGFAHASKALTGKFIGAGDKKSLGRRD